MRPEPGAPAGDRWGQAQRVALADRGFVVVPGVVPPPLVAALADATDRAVALEAEDFPPGDEQHGRVLFAPAHGGAFLDLLECEAVFAPLDAEVGADAVLYTMTTSVVPAGGHGAVDRYHHDLAPDRPGGLALTALVVLDAFTEASGATEILPGSHLWGVPSVDDALAGDLVEAEPGGVCVFDPRVWHRSTPNRTASPRRAVLVQVVRPWMKPRVDVRAFMGEDRLARLSPVARRRLGVDAAPPRSREEFLARREHRPWT